MRNNPTPLFLSNSGIRRHTFYSTGAKYWQSPEKKIFLYDVKVCNKKCNNSVTYVTFLLKCRRIETKC